MARILFPCRPFRGSARSGDGTAIPNASASCAALAKVRESIRHLLLQSAAEHPSPSCNLKTRPPRTSPAGQPAYPVTLTTPATAGAGEAVSLVTGQYPRLLPGIRSAVGNSPFV